MTTTSASPKQGSPISPGQIRCAELDSANQEARSEIVKKLESVPPPERTQEQVSVLAKAKTVGMALGSALTKVPAMAQAAVATACSSKLGNTCIPNNQVDGGTKEQRMGQKKAVREDAEKKEAAKEDSGVLCDKSYVHPGGGKGAHAECKIVNSATNSVGAPFMRGGTITLSIDWRSSTFDQGSTSGMPCPDCHRMLCHAAKVCEMKIYICDRDNQPRLIHEDCDEPGSYEDLCERVDGNPTPGRG
jgi:hypothetical protein